MTRSINNDLRLIEAGFPCHQVGAETQRERDTGKAPPTPSPSRLVGTAAPYAEPGRDPGLPSSCRHQPRLVPPAAWH